MLDRPESTKFGIFKETKTYPIWVRFSNGVGFIQPDKTRDVRGIAIKVMDVEGKKLLDGEEDARTQDFLMTNNPTALTSNAKDFMEFAEAQDSMVSQALFFLTHPRSLKVAIRIALRKIPTLLDEQYWSGTPIMLGNRAIKFSVVKWVEKPCGRNHTFLSQHANDDYLAQDLSNYAATGPICFDFWVQFQTDPYTTPIEDALVEWKKTDAPFVKVARVILPKQEFLSVKQRQFCELLNFTPWHSLPEHRPLGNMNRARKTVYEASQVFRKSGQRTPEPDGSEEF